ncbi:MAG: PIN domain-containing protein [Methylococcales bacterium]
MARLIVDTGFLVALYIRRDALHESAVDFLRRVTGTLISVPAVLVETYFFMSRENANFCGGLVGAALTSTTFRLAIIRKLPGISTNTRIRISILPMRPWFG